MAYNLYAGNSGSVCTGTPLQALTEPVAAGLVPNATFTGLSVRSYEIQAVYSGDPATFNQGASSDLRVWRPSWSAPVPPARQRRRHAYR